MRASYDFSRYLALCLFAVLVAAVSFRPPLESKGKSTLASSGFSSAKPYFSAIRLEEPSEQEERVAGLTDLAGNGRSAVDWEATPPALDAEALTTPKKGWNFLNLDLRRMIDAGAPTKGRWRRIVLHGSGSPAGNLRDLRNYHRRVRGLNSMAYHFVIGNGKGSGSGRIEVGERWHAQKDGGHLSHGYQNRSAIGICLIGNFEQKGPSADQLEALDELIDYLRAKVGKVHVATHAAMSVEPTNCPGRHFPEGLMHRVYNR